MAKKTKITKIFTIALSVLFVLNTFSYVNAANTAVREIFTNDHYVDIIDVVDGKEVARDAGKPLGNTPPSTEGRTAYAEISVGKFGDGFGMLFANNQKLDLSNKADYSLHFLARDVTSASGASIVKPTLTMKAKDFDISVDVAPNTPLGFIDISTFPLNANGWRVVDIPLTNFAEKGRYWSATDVSPEDHDPTAGDGMKFGLAKGDFSMVRGVTFIVNSWSQGNELGTHWGSVKADDIRIVSNIEVVDPAIPSYVREASTTTTSATIVWNPCTAAGVSGYNVYRGGGKINAEPVTDTYYVDDTLFPYTTAKWKYSVTAIINGTEGGKSAEIEVANKSAGDLGTVRPLYNDGQWNTRNVGTIDGYNSWSGASDEIGVDGVSSPYKFAVWSYGGVKIPLKSEFNASNANIKANSGISFWLKGNSDGSRQNKVAVGLNCNTNDTKVLENRIELDVNSTQWQYYFIPFSQFWTRGVNYEVDKYVDYAFFFSKISGISFYGINSDGAEFHIDNLRINYSYNQLEEVKYYDKNGKLLLPNNDTISKNTKRISLKFSLPLTEDEILKTSLENLTLGTTANYKLKYNKVKSVLDIEVDSLRTNCDYKVVLPDTLGALSGIGMVDKTTNPKSAAELCANVNMRKFDVTQSTTPTVLGGDKAIAFKVEVDPFAVEDLKILDGNGIKMDSVCGATMAQGSAVVSNRLQTEQNIVVLLKVCTNVNGGVRVQKITAKSFKIPVGATNLKVTTDFINLNGVDTQSSYASILVWDSMNNMASFANEVI